MGDGWHCGIPTDNPGRRRYWICQTGSQYTLRATNSDCTPYEVEKSPPFPWVYNTMTWAMARAEADYAHLREQRDSGKMNEEYERNTRVRTLSRPKYEVGDTSSDTVLGLLNATGVLFMGQMRGGLVRFSDATGGEVLLDANQIEALADELRDFARSGDSKPCPV